MISKLRIRIERNRSQIQSTLFYTYCCLNSFFASFAFRFPPFSPFLLESFGELIKLLLGGGFLLPRQDCTNRYPAAIWSITKELAMKLRPKPNGVLKIPALGEGVTFCDYDFCMLSAAWDRAQVTQLSCQATAGDPIATPKQSDQSQSPPSSRWAIDFELHSPF